MSRFANILMMYFLLEERDMVTVKEIAERLEVSTRTVKDYKKDLEELGVYVGSQLGRYGGYYLESRMRLRDINFTDEELVSLKMAKETINNGNYHYSKNFNIVVGKILNSKDNIHKVPYYNSIVTATERSLKKEKKIWNDIKLAIRQKRKLYMNYKALKTEGIEIKQRIVQPFGLFDYRGSTYFYAYCERAKDIRYFKISRIEKYEILNDKFKVENKFDFKKERENSFGIYCDSIINLKIKVTYPMSEIIKEKLICENQKIKDIDERTIIFKAQMKGYTEIKSWIMSMGSNVEVIEPVRLKEDIIDEINKLKLIYESNF